MSVLSHSHYDEIENDGSRAAEKISQFIFVRFGCLTGLIFPPYPVDVFSGNRHAGQEGVMGEPVIAFGMVFGNTAFIGPEDIHSRPVYDIAIPW